MNSTHTRSPCVAILGATGLVGREMLRLLESQDFPLRELRLLASARSVGQSLNFRSRAILIEEATADSFEGVDLVLASAGGTISKRLLPEAVQRGAVCIDNTSAFRLDDYVPLIVPEVNAHQIQTHKGIIANPNCSTIQLVVALQPLQQAFGLRRVTVATYQSVSGAGAAAVADLETGFSWVAGNVVAQIGELDEDGESEEERKMRLETPKILDISLEVEACCVRVPVARGHAEAVWIETERPVTLRQAQAALTNAPGIRLAVHDHQSQQFDPTPREHVGKHEVAVGRLRVTGPQRLGFWIVADNLLKGAALNAIQIAETLFPRKC